MTVIPLRCDHERNRVLCAFRNPGRLVCAFIHWVPFSVLQQADVIDFRRRRVP